MPRKRKNPDFPPYTSIYRGVVIYRPYNATTKLKEKPITLCNEGSPLREIWQEYLKVTENKDVDSLRKLFNEFFKSTEYTDLAKRTKDSYLIYAENICNFPVRGGGRLGEMPYNRITINTGLDYKQFRYKQAKRAGQMELSFWKRVFNWAVEYRKIQANPFKDIKIGRSKKDYTGQNNPPSDEDFEYAYRKATPVIQAAMMIALCTRSRKSEVLNLTKDQLNHIGLDTQRLKGTKDSVIEWSNALYNACNWDKSENRFSRYIIHNQNGKQYTVRGFSSNWNRFQKRVMKAAKAEDITYKHFTFHAIKHKSITDDVSDKQQGSGLTPEMVSLYDHSKPTVPSVR